MKNKSYIIPYLILLLSFGLFVSLINGNQKIDDSFETYEMLSELRATNQQIDNCINIIEPKNYDKANRHISKGNRVIKYMEKRIIDDNIKNKNILNSFKKLQDGFIEKIQIVEQCKASNSIVNNSHKNLMQLYNVLRFEIYDDDKTILEDTVLNLLTINKLHHLQKLQQLVSTKYKHNDNMQLLYNNIKVYQINLIKIKKLQSDIQKQNLTAVIGSLIKFYSSYNHNLVDNTKIIIYVFAIALLFILILNYMITKKLNNKTKELEDSIVTIDKNVIMSQTDLKGVIIKVSDAFCKISGFNRDELMGKQHNIVRHSDMKKEAFKDLWETIQKDITWSGEVKNLKKDGGFYWVNAVVDPLYRDGIKIGYTSVRHDITDKKTIIELNNSLEDKIDKEVEKNRKQDQQMLEQSRLAQMGEMISMIAHQWRQPLTAISAAGSAINSKARMGRLKDDTAIELSKDIIDYSLHLSQTINDFRDFFKDDKTKTQTNFTDIVNSSLKIVETAIQNKDIKIIKEFNCEDNFTSYPHELKQVVLNIIKNAEDVLIENNIEKPYIKINSYKQDDSIVLEISDNAGGIPEDIIDKIFNPYFSTKTKKDGTGLGLYMSKTIIEEHCGGKLSVSNSEDGAIFKIEIKGNNENNK